MADWVKSELCIDRDMEIDCDIGEWITVYIETWFDVDKKFGTNTRSNDDWWINLYARYNPLTKELLMEYIISKPDEEIMVDYKPSEADRELVINMIEEACRQYYGCTATEFLKYE